MTTRFGRFEIERFEGEHLWFGTAPRFGPEAVVVKTAAADDVDVYHQARLLSTISKTAPFQLIDIGFDDALGLPGYVIQVPGTVRRVNDALAELGPIGLAAALTHGLRVLH